MPNRATKWCGSYCRRHAPGYRPRSPYPGLGPPKQNKENPQNTRRKDAIGSHRDTAAPNRLGFPNPQGITWAFYMSSFVLFFFLYYQTHTSDWRLYGTEREGLVLLMKHLLYNVFMMRHEESNPFQKEMGESKWNRKCIRKWEFSRLLILRIASIASWKPGFANGELDQQALQNYY